MSIDTWANTVEVGEQLSLTGPDGAKAHNAGIAAAHRAGLIRLERDGKVIGILDCLDSMGGVDIVRIR